MTSNHKDLVNKIFVCSAPNSVTVLSSSDNALLVMS